jgi:hypothetical protein
MSFVTHEGAGRFAAGVSGLNRFTGLKCFAAVDSGRRGRDDATTGLFSRG